MTIQTPPGNNSNHLEPIMGNGNASRAHQAPFTTPLPVDHLLGKLFKYLTRCGRGACAVRIHPPLSLPFHEVAPSCSFRAKDKPRMDRIVQICWTGGGALARRARTGHLF